MDGGGAQGVAAGGEPGGDGDGDGVVVSTFAGSVVPAWVDGVHVGVVDGEDGVQDGEEDGGCGGWGEGIDR